MAWIMSHMQVQDYTNDSPSCMIMRSEPWRSNLYHMGCNGKKMVQHSQRHTMINHCDRHTACTARFSKKSPWSVFFRGEMSVICHKITIKCRWNHGETVTAKIYKLGPKCRWNILIVGDNTAAKIKRVYTYM
jgi:hypothetical protein